jgi:hypothetical protein
MTNAPSAGAQGVDTGRAPLEAELQLLVML